MAFIRNYLVVRWRFVARCVWAFGSERLGHAVMAKARICAPGRSFMAVEAWFLIALAGQLSWWAPAGFPLLAQVENPLPHPASTMPGLTGVPPGTRIDAELKTTLDVLATRTGDEIAMRVTKNLKRRGRKVVHEGDQLVGRVISVRPQSVSKGQKSSEIDILFDRLTSGAHTFRLNAVIHSVLWIPGQAVGTPTGTNNAQPSWQHVEALRGPHAGMTGQAAAASHGGGTGGVESAGSNVGPQRGVSPLDSIQARSGGAADGRAGGVSLLTDRQGNLRLSAGTRMDLRTQNP